MDVAPYYVNSVGGTQIASVTGPETWTTYERAVEYATRFSMGIGYVLIKDDPYVCIDADNKLLTPADPASLQWYWALATKLGSYTELSPSGRGLHTWIRATLPAGARKENFEIYPYGRYIRCTGWAVINAPIKEDQEFADTFFRMLGGDAQIVVEEELEEIAPEREDHEVLEIAYAAANSGKFKDLYEGRWEAHFKDESQSEADAALMTMLAYYSKSNAQCLRLFLASALGQRKKALRKDYLKKFTLPFIRGRQKEEEPKVDISAFTKTVVAPVVAPTPVLDTPAVEIPLPAGLVGGIAEYIYNQATRPVREVAIAAALGLMAGMCGKAWNVRGTGLNMYLILVARSAIGKEAMHSGLSSLCKVASAQFPGVQDFITFTDFASGPALVKYCADHPSFVNVSGEWGRKLRRLADDHSHDAGMGTLRTSMLNLYQKSGAHSMAGGISYSNRETSVDSLEAVAYSLIGETTPQTLYDALTESMMEDGFLSRFTIIEYPGERPDENETPLLVPDPILAEAVAALATQASSLIQRGYAEPVGFTPDAYKLIKGFNKECDAAIKDAGANESKRQMWNRAALKALRIAALLAIGISYSNPVIRVDEYQWALNYIIRPDIAIMQRKLSEGDIGINDTSRRLKMLVIIKEYLSKETPTSYKVPAGMRHKNIITYQYLNQRCSQNACFSKHKNDSTEAVKAILKSLVDSGNLQELPIKFLKESFSGFHGKAYVVLDLPD